MAVIKAAQVGAALIEEGFLTEEKLAEALAEQQRTGRLLGRVLLDNLYVTEEQLAKVIAAQQGIVFVDLRRFDVSPEIVQVLTEIQARRFHAIILEDRGDHYVVGFVDPSDLRAQDDLSRLLGKPIDVAVITSEQFSKTADRIYRKTEQIDEYAKEVERDLERESGVVDLGHMDVAIDDMDAPVVKLLQTIFEEAAHMRASDVHIEPQDKKLVVRFRIDGTLHPQLEADPKISSPLMVRLKLMAGLDIGEKRLPQDGRFAIRTGSNRIDIRMSTLPTQHGESVVMRLLMQGRGLLDLDKSGMPAHMVGKFRSIIQSPHGIVLVTGPTGSGKSTTLYAALQELNQPNVKILTCEDPVEYRIPGINQVQVNEKIEFTFARVLRSFLRQDPDILLVGEIRDQETAQIAARAAMTGHMVLSSLHTNDAASTPARLLDMGVPSYMIASSLLAVVSQRLLRVICDYCSEPYRPGHDQIEWFKHYQGDDVSAADFRYGVGCSRCNGVGFTGRVGVYEMLEMTAPLAAAIHKGDAVQFEHLAREQMGSGTLDRQELDLVVKGKTTIAEAMTVVASAEI
ncbi:MAG: type II/IV secretion system protein [Rhodocyclaceae bacterium]|nr:MAG: type II/IV secretion system protein [Rhodocyclaceae bacterium]